MLSQSTVAAVPHVVSTARPKPLAAHVERGCAIAEAVVAIAARGWPDACAKRRPARAAAFDRQIAMYLAHVGFGFSMAAVGRAFGRGRTTVVHACHLIEDRRDDSCFDAMLDHLEQAAIALRDADTGRPE